MSRIIAPAVRGRYLPLVDVAITIDSRSFEIPALIDSGSSTTIVPSEVLEVHGVQFGSLGEQRSGVGAGGTLLARVADAQIRWRGTSFASRFAVAEPGRLPVALLGREDFFRTFEVCFDWTGPQPLIDIDPSI